MDMEESSKLPPNIESFVSTINELENKTRLTTAEKKKLCLCKLKIAVWACRAEGLELSRYALTQILGTDTAEVFAKTEQIMAEIAWDNQDDLILNRQIMKKYSQPKGGKKSGGSFELFK